MSLPGSPASLTPTFLSLPPSQAASSALSSLGHVYTAIGDYPNALASHKQCVLLAKQGKDDLSEARELGNMGAVYIAMGDFENAVGSHEQHLKIAKELGNRREEARAYSNLGSAYHYRRHFDKAMSYHNHVLALAQELGEKAIEMRAYAGLGHAARCLQDLERAKRYHEEQLGIAQSLQDRAAEGRASSNLGQWVALCELRGVGSGGGRGKMVQGDVSPEGPFLSSLLGLRPLSLGGGAEKSQVLQRAPRGLTRLCFPHAPPAQH